MACSSSFKLRLNLMKDSTILIKLRFERSGNFLYVKVIFCMLRFFANLNHFHNFAKGAACKQRMLTPLDTWSCPTLGLACVLMLRPISPELALLPDC